MACRRGTSCRKFSMNHSFRLLLVVLMIGWASSAGTAATQDPQVVVLTDAPAQVPAPPQPVPDEQLQDAAVESPAITTRTEMAREAIAASGTLPPDRLLWHIPDPEWDRPVAVELLEKAREAKDAALVAQLSRIIERIDSVRRPDKQVRLTLDEVLHRTLANNYTIEVANFGPAIETTRVVEAEAAFDAVFFTSVTKNKQDQPTGTQLAAGDLDAFQLSSGVRKQLPSGATVSGTYELSRVKTTLQFQQINPEYNNNLALALRQPLLRRFGQDYNRSFIVIAEKNHSLSEFALERQVRDVLRQVEELYWRLVEARRNVVITARLIAGFEQIYEYLLARQDFDVTPVQLAATKANLEQSRAEFIRVRATVLDAEDQLIAAMNDPSLNLADHPEIIPEDFPTLERIHVDRLAEVQTALDNRSEVREQKLRIDIARLVVGQAKNEQLPQFDLVFQYTIAGLAGNADKAFDELSRHNYVDYFVGVEFEMPIGNRGPRAAHRRAELQHRQAIAQLKAVYEEVIFDVNRSVRLLDTSYDQIAPAFEAAQAREREVDSIVARAERKDINTLTTELNARQALAAARRAMLQNMVNYNISIIDLERAKGTLLRYNQIEVPISDKESAKSDIVAPNE